jgi:hypothetical protein
MAVELKADVDTRHVSSERRESGSQEGRLSRTWRDGVKSVKPVVLGDGVTAVKNWNLFLVSCHPLADP